MNKRDRKFKVIYNFKGKILFNSLVGVKNNIFIYTRDDETK
ncbi:hypothetical protein LCDVSa047L [Lymphocystis disease virus 3]|uniref:Uncharacterized protein n=1 Tax=Lymphocystis disease virus 3 TaxID=2560566 RepID=A0A1B2RVW1_9VIRU|nr:hypothetical protein BZK12_gp047 [Lymphocystis disease virus Sa]AOC55131.1 hypothetical protein LCDVSa047L [Lymphocystis disease virus 3]